MAASRRRGAEKRRKTATVDEYLATLPGDQRAALGRLRRIIRATSPRIEEAVSYGMPVFRLDGRWVVWIGAAARHCAIYGVHAVANELDGYDTSGRGTLRFQPDEPLPAALVRKLVKARIAQNAAKTVRKTAARKPKADGGTEMTDLVYAALAVAAGAAATVQAATNAGLARATGLGPAVVVNTIVVLVASIGLWAAMGAPRTFLPAGTPWTLYLGGVFGFVIVASLTVVFPKIGAAYAIALMVGGQCLAALVVDHYGLIGMPREPMTLQRLVGAALVAAGIAVFRM